MLGALGARYLTIHASGGETMMRAAIEGLTEGATDAGLPVPTTLAVLILTSHKNAPASLLTEQLCAAVNAGSPGIVAAAADLPTIRANAPTIFTVTPDIRMPSGDTHDQARVSTPGEAIAKSANLLVIGRAVTAAQDPASAAAEVAADVQTSLATQASRA